METTIIDRVRASIEQSHVLSPGDAAVVGVSGGADSLCLLHTLHYLQSELGISVHVAHLHHGLRGDEADADAEFVRVLATRWSLPITVGRAEIAVLARELGLAVEETARRARYAFLAQVAAEVGAPAIAVGHNADDQAETILMHFVRGSGLAGLRGMLPVTELEDYRLSDVPSAEHEIGHPKLLRPLLDVTRAEIEGYCQVHGLVPRFDRSNLDTTYFRNWLRHETLPLLARHNPNIAEVLRRSARVITDDYALLRSLLDEAWPRVVREEALDRVVFDLAAWRSLPTSLQRSSLREAIHRLRRSLRNINFVHVEDALRVARDGTTGDQATLPQELMLTLGYDRLTVAGVDWSEDWAGWPLLPPGTAPLPLALPGRTWLPGGDWLVDVRLVDRDGLPAGWDANADPWQAFLAAVVAEANLALRTRRPGDRFQPLGLGGHSAKLADFLTNAKVPHSVRDRLPLVGCDWGIAWVCGHRVDERAAVRLTTRRILWLRFQRR